MFMRFVIFLCFVVALNCFLTSATGRLYDFWLGRRGGGRVIAVITSPAMRFVFALAGLIFLFLSVHFWVARDASNP
jgi:hypothetical protein